MLQSRTFLIAAILLLLAIPVSAAEGLVTKQSAYAADATLDRLEAALKEKGFVIFARLDHAAAAESVGLKMPPSTVLVFGNPRAGTANFITHPTLAIDLPLKALVWEDDKGTVWLSYNSAEYLLKIFGRHGVAVTPEATKGLEASLAAVTDAAVKGAAEEQNPAPEPLRVGGEVKAPVVVKRVEPDMSGCDFPDGAKPSVFMAEVIIDTDGSVESSRMVKPTVACADEAFLRSLEAWQFKPATLDGKPVRIRYNLNLNVRWAR